MELKRTMAENSKLASECTMLNQKLANITTQFSELALNDTENVSKLSIADEIKLKIVIERFLNMHSKSLIHRSHVFYFFFQIF